MAERREKGFPNVGERVLAEDGSVWAFVQGDGDPTWEQQDPGLSAAELDQREGDHAALLKALSLDHRVYALAFGGVRTVKREQDLNESDPKEAFVLALATSAMRDSIVGVVSGERSDLEKRTGARLRSFLGDPEWGTVQAELNRLRVQVTDEDTPEGVAAKARGPLNELADLAGKLPQDSDARKTITRIVSSRKPQPELADTLFRELVTSGVDVETAKHAQGAASSVAKAYE